ncbi:MAG: hypothetical protein EX267_11470 [Acidimicrobiia bacterium]|nr:MAG: hypothetical protein EX267_11470 [Acidimicrobiia bacterium]
MTTSRRRPPRVRSPRPPRSGRQPPPHPNRRRRRQATNCSPARPRRVGARLRRRRPRWRSTPQWTSRSRAMLPLPPC